MSTNPTLQWFPIATAPRDGTEYLATDWKQFRNENHPRGYYAGYWTNIGNDWQRCPVGSFEAIRMGTASPVKPKHLKE